MPIYEFECSHCGHRFDRLQKLSDTDPSICPACDAPQLRRRVSAPSFRLAGSGWYETDFKKDGDRKRNLADAAGGDKSTSSGDSATAVTPASAPAAPAAPASKVAGSE
ncbi:zinc ribbon domain-containing protein [Rhodanobacter sp. C05]|uniref:FmdB family zinc ribbon protein n=1 Tax=Rhodanobacter sp. C05 TaxID=1945855 RepID=UPI000985105E|nr:zinc ribbon domain-containing protein [Rhodanobacter sp. C05]OOG42555.1 transcriptional regulator [Rhodanobacter sp. C05]